MRRLYIWPKANTARVCASSSGKGQWTTDLISDGHWRRQWQGRNAPSATAFRTRRLDLSFTEPFPLLLAHKNDRVSRSCGSHVLYIDTKQDQLHVYNIMWHNTLELDKVRKMPSFIIHALVCCIAPARGLFWEWIHAAPSFASYTQQSTWISQE